MDKSLKSGGNNSLGSASIALPGRKLVTSKNPRMLTPSEIDLLQQDLKAALERDEETAAIEQERKTFQRRQLAFEALNRQLLPVVEGSLESTRAVAEEFNAAEAAWREAVANSERILDEIQTGKR